MPIPSNKTDLQIAIKDNYAKLIAEFVDISTAQAAQKELDGHAANTTMSVNNLIAYLIGWGDLVLKWYDRKNQVLTVDFPETGYQWNELGRLAQKFYADYETDDFETLQAQLNQTTNELLSLIEAKTNEELYETEWYGKWTLGRMIQLNTAAPFKNARSRIKQWKKRQKG